MIKQIINPDKFTGYHMIAVITLFFGTIIAVNLTLAFYASSSWTGLVVKNTYIASQIFEDKKLEREKQRSLGWHSDVLYQDGMLRLVISDGDGKGINAANVMAKIGRVTHENDDQLLTLLPNPTGGYFVKTELYSGVWNVDVTVLRRGEADWVQPFRILVE
jgi:nitrogen fixation protein FixH